MKAKFMWHQKAKEKTGDKGRGRHILKSK